MSQPTTDYVTRCALRKDGAWLVLTRSGASAIATEEMLPGQQVTLANGRADRVKQPGGVHG